MSLWSRAYKCQQVFSCLRLLRQAMLAAFCFDFERAGSNSAARMAMTAITTSNSIKVNAGFLRTRWAADPQGRLLPQRASAPVQQFTTGRQLSDHSLIAL